MSPKQCPSPAFASLALLLLLLCCRCDSTSSRGHGVSLLPREDRSGINGEDEISFAGRNLPNENEESVERVSEADVSDSRDGRRRPYVPLNSLTFMTANSQVSSIDWSSTDPSQIRQYIAGSKLGGVAQTSTIRPASQNQVTPSRLPPFPLIRKTTTKGTTPSTREPFQSTTRRSTLPTTLRSTILTRPSVSVNTRSGTTPFRASITTTVRPTVSATTRSTTSSRSPTATTTRRLTTPITGRPIDLTKEPITTPTSPIITWRPSTLTNSNSSTVKTTSPIITWRPSSLAIGNTSAFTRTSTTDEPTTPTTESTTIESIFLTQWFTTNDGSLSTEFISTEKQTQSPPTVLPPPPDFIKPPVLSTWRPTFRPIPNPVKVTTHPPTSHSMSSSTTQLPVNQLNPSATTENSPDLSGNNNFYSTSAPAIQDSYSPTTKTTTSSAPPVRKAPIPNYVNVTTQPPTNHPVSSSKITELPVFNLNSNSHSTSLTVIQAFDSMTRATSSAPLQRITILPQNVTSQSQERPVNHDRFNYSSTEDHGTKPIKHSVPPKQQENSVTEHEPLNHWQYLNSNPQSIHSHTTISQPAITNTFISDNDQKIINEALNRFQTQQVSSAIDSSTNRVEYVEDEDVSQISTVEEPGAVGLAPQQPLWTTQQLDDNKTPSILHDDMIWYFDSSSGISEQSDHNPNISWITNPRPQLPHNIPLIAEVTTRGPLITPDPALFEINGSSNERPEIFPYSTTLSRSTTSRPIQTSPHTTSREDLFTLSDSGSHFTRASILRPLVSPEVQVDTNAELFRVSQSEVVPSSSAAVPLLPTVDDNDYDFDYAVYEDDLSEYYAAYGYLLGDEHEEDKVSKPDRLLTFDLDKNSPSILETLTWPYTTIPTTQRPYDSDSTYSWSPAVVNKNSHETLSDIKNSSDLITLNNESAASLPLTISANGSSYTTVSPTYTYTSLITDYPQSQSTPPSLGETYYYFDSINDKSSIYPEYDEVYYYDYKDTSLENNLAPSSIKTTNLESLSNPTPIPYQPSIHLPVGQTEDFLNIRESTVNKPLGEERFGGASTLEKIPFQPNNNPHNLNVYNAGFLDTSYIPKIIKTTTTTRRPPVLYVPADRETQQQSHSGSPNSDLATFVALNPLRPSVVSVEQDSIESEDTEINFSDSSDQPIPVDDTSHNYVHYGHISQNTNLNPSGHRISTTNNMYHLFSSPFLVKENQSILPLYEHIAEENRIQSQYPPHEFDNGNNHLSPLILKNRPNHLVTPSNPSIVPSHSPETYLSSDSQRPIGPPNINLPPSNNFLSNNSSSSYNDSPSIDAKETTHPIESFLLRPHSSSSFLNPSYAIQQETFPRNHIKRISLTPASQKTPHNSEPSSSNFQGESHLSHEHFSPNSEISLAQSSTASKENDHAITVTQSHAQSTEVGSNSSSVLTVTDPTFVSSQPDNFSIKFAESGSNLAQSDGADQHNAHPSNHNSQENHHPSVQVKIWKMVDGQLRLVEEQSVPSEMFHNSGLTNGAVVNPQDVPAEVLSMVATKMEDPNLLYSLFNYTTRIRRSLPNKAEYGRNVKTDLEETDLKKNESKTILHHIIIDSMNSHAPLNSPPGHGTDYIKNITKENTAIAEKLQVDGKPSENLRLNRLKEAIGRQAISPNVKTESTMQSALKTSRMNDESTPQDTPVIHLVIPNLKEQPNFNTLLQRLATQSQQTEINKESQINQEYLSRNEKPGGLAFPQQDHVKLQNYQPIQATVPAPHRIPAFGGVGNNNLPITPPPITVQNVPSPSLLPQASKPEVSPKIEHFGGVGNRNHTNLPLGIGTSLDENNLGYLHILSHLADRIQDSNVQNPSLHGFLRDITKNSPGIQASGGVVGYSAAGTLLNSGVSAQGNGFSQLLQEPSIPGEHRGSVLELLPSDLPHVNPLLPSDEPVDHPVSLSEVLGSLPSSNTLHREQLRNKLATLTGTNTFSGHLGNEGFLNQNNHALQNSVLGNQGEQPTFNQFTSDSQIPHSGNLVSPARPGPFERPNLPPALPSNSFINTRPSNSFFPPNQQNSPTAIFGQQSFSPVYPQPGNQNLQLPESSISSSQQMASQANYQQTVINRADVLSIIDRLQSQGSVPNAQLTPDFGQTEGLSSLPLQQPASTSPFDPSLPYRPFQDAPSFIDSPFISSIPGGTLTPNPATVTSSNVQGCVQSTLCSLGLASLVALGISNAIALPFLTPFIVGRRRRMMDFSRHVTGQRESLTKRDEILREILAMSVSADPGFIDILSAAIAFHVDTSQQEKNKDHIVLNAAAKKYLQLLLSLKKDQISFLIQHALTEIGGEKQPEENDKVPAQKSSSYIASTPSDSVSPTETSFSK